MAGEPEFSDKLRGRDHAGLEPGAAQPDALLKTVAVEDDGHVPIVRRDGDAFGGASSSAATAPSQLTSKLATVSMPRRRWLRGGRCPDCDRWARSPARSLRPSGRPLVARFLRHDRDRQFGQTGADRLSMGEQPSDRQRGRSPQPVRLRSPPDRHVRWDDIVGSQARAQSTTAPTAAINLSPRSAAARPAQTGSRRRIP